MKTTNFFESGGGGPKRPRKVKLTVEVMASDRKAAEKLARLRTLQGLEAMLGELVADMATAYERPGAIKRRLKRDRLKMDGQFGKMLQSR